MPPWVCAVFSHPVRASDLVLWSAGASAAPGLLPDPDPEPGQPVPPARADLHGVRQIGTGCAQWLRTG